MKVTFLDVTHTIIVFATLKTWKFENWFESFWNIHQKTFSWSWHQGLADRLLHEAYVDEAGDPDDADAAHAGAAGGEAEGVKGASANSKILFVFQIKKKLVLKKFKLLLNPLRFVRYFNLDNTSVLLCSKLW